ncbi:MAG TPA: glutathione S-transferase family protein [Thermoanaerobaculia bacterium]|nr:glutathione S-transferase family protein [Thermoanaerobaculia bacterium]
MIRVHRIAHSTNVERVALAAGVKGIEVEWVDHEPGDRTAVREVSGQDLVPVAEVDGEIVVDSMRIVERLEALKPEPPLYESAPHARAELDIFVDWFNLVWKGPPNELDDELAKAAPNAAAVEDLTARTRGWTPLFEAMLTGRAFLGGDSLGARDIAAFPFLKYAVIEIPEDDDEPFHFALERCLKPADAYPLLCDWVRRVDSLPRA